MTMSRAFRLGVFVVCTLAALSAGVFLIGERQFLFSSTYKVKAAFKNVVGLNAGAEVHVGGIHKGIVKQIQLPAEPSGDMTVVLQMEKSTRSVIRKDSVATIQAEGLLGNKYMEISFGSADAPEIRDGDSISGVPPLEIADLLKKTLKPVIWESIWLSEL
jgi:phospholipid/cholesterol/gamma-HCH transport system substrate-binding protein